VLFRATLRAAPMPVKYALTRYGGVGYGGGGSGPEYDGGAAGDGEEAFSESYVYIGGEGAICGSPPPRSGNAAR
jgi:hypothetical protein